MSLTIKPTYPVTEEEKKEITIGSNSIDIVNEDGCILYTLDIHEDASMTVSSSSAVKVNNQILDTTLLVKPKASNQVTILREEYKS